MIENIAAIDKKITQTNIRQSNLEWTGVDFEDGWANDSSLPDLEYAVDPTGRVIFRGACKPPASPTDTNILLMPTNLRPDATAGLLVGYQNDSPANYIFDFGLELTPGGYLVYPFGASIDDRIFFDGTRYTP